MDGVFISFGSNVGDRERYIRRAVQLVECVGAGTLCALSSLYETEPAEGVGGHVFLNGVLKMSTPVEPRGLLERLQSIERQLDRTGKGQGLPRTIDLDIVLYGQRIVSLPDLVIPHPKMARRPFVLVPMAEVDPGYIHPVMKRTIRELLEHVDDVSSVRFYKKMDHERMDGRGMSAC